VSTSTSGLPTALRAWRDRLSPVDAGLTTSAGGRRAPGLRREELAHLAGISVDYLTRLEQGRASAPSRQVVAALARALQLGAGERDHLYRCAGLLPPRPGLLSDHVPAGVQRLVARLGDLPLAVFAADWTLVSWTPLWAALLGDPLLVPAAERNLVRQTFLRPAEASASAFVEVVPAAGVEHLRAALVADLRAAAGLRPDDPRLLDLVVSCRTRSPEFARLWDSGVVGVHESDRKTVRHPQVGDLTLDCDVLTVPGADLRIVAYTAARGTPDADRLDLLRVVGGAERGILTSTA
jgi:transcriptional regulator with XRE-family HTH domain